MTSTHLDTSTAPTAPATAANDATHHPWQILSSTGLKWVAVVTMLIDHIAAVLVWGLYLKARSHGGPDAAQLYDIYYAMRCIGRTAFPIFCFVLTEGFVHTRSRPKYALRLLLFAIVSEIPYDLALHGGTVAYDSKLNIMFTMLLAFCALWLADEAGERLGMGEGSRILLTIVTICIAAYFSQAQFLDTSYHVYGIILIGTLYLARKSRLVQVCLGYFATYWYCRDAGSDLQAWAILGLLAIALYNGQRGRGMKYFFYLFYPLHLLILWGLTFVVL